MTTIRIAIGATLLGLVATSAVGLFSVVRVNSGVAEIEQDRSVERAAHVVLDALKDAETGSRGFVLTGREIFLAPYESALPGVAPALAKAEALADGDAELGPRIRDLRDATTLKLQHLAEVIALRRSGDEAAARALVASGRGKERMDRVRAIVAEVEGIEDRRIRTWQAAQRRAASTSVVATSIALAVGLALGALALALVRRLVSAATAVARAQIEHSVSAEREAWFRALAECIDVGILVVDRQGRTLYANEQLQRLSGVTAEAMPDMRSNAIFPPDVREERDAVIRRIEGGEISGTAEITIERPDGQRRRILLRWAPLATPRGDTERIVMAQADVTEAHEMRARLRELVRRLDHVRDGESAAFATRLHEGVAQDVYAAKLRLTQVRAGGERAQDAIAWLDALLTRLVREIRGISNELEPRGLSHVAFAALATPAVEAFAGRTGVDVRTDFGPEPALAPAAKIMLLRALRECLDNVERHARASTVEIRCASEQDGLTLAVRDDGVGMRDAVDDARGLGLLMIRERALELGGRVSIEAAAPTGTRVSVWIPARQPVAPPPAAESAGLRHA